MSVFNVKYTSDFNSYLVSGEFLELDSQLKYLVHRTGLPIRYAHILARHVVTARLRVRTEKWVLSQFQN